MTIEVLYIDVTKAKGGFLGNFGVKVSAWNNLEISNIAWIRNKDGKEFIVLPNKKKQDDEGKWVLDIQFVTMPSDIFKNFAESCLKAIKVFKAEEAARTVSSSGNLFVSDSEMDDSEIPF